LEKVAIITNRGAVFALDMSRKGRLLVTHCFSKSFVKSRSFSTTTTQKGGIATKELAWLTKALYVLSRC